MDPHSIPRREIIYIYDEDLEAECNRLPSMLNRASIVQDLINSYGILKSEKVLVVRSIKAREHDLNRFHSSSYIDILKKTNTMDDTEEFEKELAQYGLNYDCPILERNYDFVCRIAGGTLTAAMLLCRKISRIAINWCGGWHHAQSDEAEGFCYVNDIVLGIQKLQHAFGKILYVDLDVHHGNGVQKAFELSKNVLTLSFHKHEIGFYPGTGLLDDVGKSSGSYYCINVPFLSGICDKNYTHLFNNIFERVYSSFEPSAIVLQCGADILFGDHVGQCNVTINALVKCVKKVIDCNIPCLVLGGGGYNFANTARYWTCITSTIIDTELDDDIPDCSEYFTLYAPTYELQIYPGNQKDYNTEEYIANVIDTIRKYCDFITTNKVQI
ncbi:Histone deacetylase domain [Popillia japonica]|uniref:Histone deacetylase n=1 Tax=Popillia japonica TaxID=7064 RepID=A0AAW1K037_POPJA